VVDVVKGDLIDEDSYLVFRFSRCLASVYERVRERIERINLEMKRTCALMFYRSFVTRLQLSGVGLTGKQKYTSIDTEHKYRTVRRRQRLWRRLALVSCRAPVASPPLCVSLQLLHDHFELYGQERFTTCKPQLRVSRSKPLNILDPGR
jgi:hypothetical protein